MSSVYAHLDRSAYWRSRADLVKADLERTQDEAVDLRREVASLKRKLDNQQSVPVKKRKKQDPDVILVPRSPKRARRTVSPERGLTFTSEHPTDDEFSQAGELGTFLYTDHGSSLLMILGDALLRSVYHILAAFRTTQRTKPVELAYHIERASSTVPQIVQREVQKIVTEQALDNERLKTALDITTRTITTVLAGYTRLTHAHDASDCVAAQGRVIYAVVSMFRELLGLFQLLSAEEIDRATLANEVAALDRPSTAQTPFARPTIAPTTLARPSTARMSSPEKRSGPSIGHARPSTASMTSPEKPRGKVVGMPKPSTAQMPLQVKPKPKGRPQQIQNRKVMENATLSLYATFLGKLVDMLDPRVEANRALFEGFAYCILDRLGKRLYSIVFGHSRASDLEAEIKQDVDLDQDPSESEIPPPPADDDERKQIKLEAPYLLYLLNRIMIAAPAHFGKVKTSKAKTSKAPSKNTLALSAKECLQRTLVNAIFGTEGVKDDDPFQECLKMPKPVGATLTMPKVKEVDVLEHFKEEVWRCLGWDILSKEDDW